MQEEDLNKKLLLKPQESQNIQPIISMKKSTYRYLSKHHAKFMQSDLNDQAVKRRDIVRWNFIGDLNKNMKLKRLCNLMKKMKRGKEFLLVTVPEKTITEREFAEIGEAIKRQRGLQKIYMDWIFTTGKYLNEKQINGLAQGIQRVATLKDVKISVDQRKFSDQAFNVLSQSFRRLCALENLSIRFRNTNRITDKGLKEFGKRLKRLEYLRDIAIDFSSKRITTSGLEVFGQYLKMIKPLKHIWLSLKWLEMDALGKLSEILKEIRQLQKTTVDFNIQAYRYDGDDIIKDHLCPGLEGLKDLQALALKSLSVHMITDDGMILLCETLEKLKNLQELQLYYGGITAKGIEILSETLKKFSCLKAFDSSINPESLSNDEISIFSEGLKTLVSLEKLALMIPRGGVTNQGLEVLAEALKQLKSLRIVKLDLGRLDEIDDQGIDVLTRSFQELSLLRDVALIFKNCPKITNETLRILGRNLKQIPRLREIRLRFEDCEQVGLKETLELKDSLKKGFICKVRHSSDSVGPWDYP